MENIRVVEFSNKELSEAVVSMMRGLDGVKMKEIIKISHVVTSDDRHHILVVYVEDTTI